MWKKKGPSISTIISICISVSISPSISTSKNKNKLAKNGPILKFQMLIALKCNLNGGQFHKELSKFGYFDNL